MSPADGDAPTILPIGSATTTAQNAGDRSAGAPDGHRHHGGDEREQRSTMTLTRARPPPHPPATRDERARPSATPAIVGWIPDRNTSTQVTRPSTMSTGTSHPPRARELSRPNASDRAAPRAAGSGCSDVVKNAAMMTIAIRSSITARASSSARTRGGSRLPKIESTTECERDVRRGRDRPSHGEARRDQQVEHCGYDDPAERCDPRHERLPRRIELSVPELVLELDGREQEEDRRAGRPSPSARA